jgi:hypothetical protein
MSSEDRELFLGGGAVGIEGDEEHALALLVLEALGDLGGGGGLAGALQADHEHAHRRHRGEIEAGAVQHRGLGSIRVAAEHAHEFVVDDLHDHLAGGDRLDHRLADGLLADRGDEVLHHRQGDVGLQQRHAHLAHGGGDVGLRQRAAARELAENRTQPFRQSVEHRRSENPSAKRGPRPCAVSRTDGPGEATKTRHVRLERGGNTRLSGRSQGNANNAIYFICLSRPLRGGPGQPHPPHL